MLRNIWKRHQKLILVSLLFYLAIALALILGSRDAADLPFDYQLR